MPRGVYDRSKLKKTKTTETVSAAPKAPKGKPGRKPGSGAKAVVTSAPAKVSGNELELFSTVRANLDTLNSLASKFGDIPTIKSEVAAHVDLFTSLREKVFGTKSTETVVSNGTAPTQYASSVPMPPAPIPSIPATH